MLDDHGVAQEWAKVKDFPSLFQHYGSQAEYQRWRQGVLSRKAHERSPRSTKIPWGTEGPLPGHTRAIGDKGIQIRRNK